MRSALVAILMLLAVPAVCRRRSRRAWISTARGSSSSTRRTRARRRAWHSRGVPFARTIAVPGAWQAQGVGEPKGTLRHDYAGAAWYRRTVAIPAAWRGKSVRFRIGGAHRYTTLFVNGTEDRRAPRVQRAVRLRRDRRRPPGRGQRHRAAHREPGRRPARGAARAEADPPDRHAELHRATGAASTATWNCRPPTRRGSSTSTCGRTSSGRSPGSSSRVRNRATSARSRARCASPWRRVRRAGRESRLPPAGARKSKSPWPSPMRACGRPSSRTSTPPRSRCESGRQRLDRVEERFGMRQLQTRGNVLLLNGKPLYLRGYGDDNIEVLTRLPALVARGLSSSGCGRRAPSASTRCASTR